VPPPKKKKLGPLKIILIAVVALIVIVGIANAVSGGGKEQPKADSTNSTTEKSDGKDKGSDPKKEEPEKKEEPDQPKLGQPVVAGDLEFTLASYKCGVTVKDLTGETLKPQGQFCKLEVAIKNVGKSEALLTDDAVKLLGAEGVEYSSSSDTWFVKDALKFETVNPGNTVKGVVYFDVPKDAAPSVAAVGGGFLTSAVEVSLT